LLPSLSALMMTSKTKAVEPAHALSQLRVLVPVLCQIIDIVSAALAAPAKPTKAASPPAIATKKVRIIQSP
jgi:hypothetical protein